MLDWISADPGRAVILAVAAVAIVALAIAVWFELYKRVRRYGGGPLAGAVTGVGVALLILALVPGLLSFEIGLLVLIAAFLVLYRPELVVRYTGGPRKEWSALREGRELALLVAERGGPAAAGGDPEIAERVAGLDAFEAPSTTRYLALVRRTLLADPADESLAADRAELAEADAALRAAIGVRPTWEKALEARARGEAPSA